MAKPPVNQIALLAGVTSTGAGVGENLQSFLYDNDDRNFVAHVAGTGSVSATVLVQVSNNNIHWVTLATITLSGTDSATDGFVSDEAWQYVRGYVSAISGTGSAVTLTMGV